MLPNLARLSVDARDDRYAFAFTQRRLRVSFSLVDTMNKFAHWRAVQRRRLRLGVGDEASSELESELVLVEKALEEYDLWRKWLVVCSSPPLVFARGNGEEVSRMITWLAQQSNSVKSGETRAAPSSLEESTMVKEIRTEYKSQEDASKLALSECVSDAQMSKAEDKRFVQGPRLPAQYVGRRFWPTMIDCGVFGAEAPRTGVNRNFKYWWGELLVRLTDATSGLDPPSSSPGGSRSPGKRKREQQSTTPAADSLDGSAYNGDMPLNRNFQDFTIEHVIPKDWCHIPKVFYEFSGMFNNIHLITLATSSENASRGTKALSFVVPSTQYTPQNEIHSWMSPYLYNPTRFTKVRKAAVARVTACAFLTYPTISDDKPYIQWPDRIGVPVYAEQWSTIQALLSQPPTEWEKRLNWTKWRVYKWNNAFIHDTRVLTGRELEGVDLRGIDELLRKRFYGDDALGQLLLSAVLTDKLERCAREVEELERLLHLQEDDEL